MKEIYNLKRKSKDFYRSIRDVMVCVVYIKELLNRGFIVNHKRVQRLMENHGLAGKRPKENITLIKVTSRQNSR